MVEYPKWKIRKYLRNGEVETAIEGPITYTWHEVMLVEEFQRLRIGFELRLMEKSREYATRNEALKAEILQLKREILFLEEELQIWRKEKP